VTILSQNNVGPSGTLDKKDKDKKKKFILGTNHLEDLTNFLKNFMMTQAKNNCTGKEFFFF